MTLGTVTFVLFDGSMLLVLLMMIFLLQGLGLFCVKFLCSILSKAHLGYFHLVRTFLRGCCSALRSYGMEQTVLALCAKVLITLDFAAM